MEFSWLFPQDGKEFAECQNLLFMETSAKLNHQVTEAFSAIGERVRAPQESRGWGIVTVSALLAHLFWTPGTQQEVSRRVRAPVSWLWVNDREGWSPRAALGRGVLGWGTP